MKNKWKQLENATYFPKMLMKIDTILVKSQLKTARSLKSQLHLTEPLQAAF